MYVSEIGFGTIPILKGNVPVLPDYFNLDTESAIAVMERARQLGCNLFDTAVVPEYGDAEIKTGMFAARTERSQLVLSDKARFFTGDEMYRAVLRSCENLGTYADLYFVHQVDEENQDIVFGKYGALDALTELKAEGKIRFTGIASHYFSVLLRGARDSRTDVLQGSGNLLERGMLNRMKGEPLFREKGFLVNKVYAAGILPKFFPVEKLINEVLSYPVSSALIGIGTEAQADAAMHAALADYQPMSFSEVLSVLEKTFPAVACDRCQQCSCPEGTEIHTVMRQLNYYYMGKDYWALRKLDMGIQSSAQCCASCLKMPCIKQCPRKIRIPDRIQEIAQLVDAHVRYSRI